MQHKSRKQYKVNVMWGKKQKNKQYFLNPELSNTSIQGHVIQLFVLEKAERLLCLGHICTLV